MVGFIMPKYKIIFAFIIFCFFQTNQSISLELKIPKIGDLKKITEDIKKELDKKDKSKKTKKKEVSENKISNCNANNNYIYYSDVSKDKYYKNVTIWNNWNRKGQLKKVLSNYSFIAKSENKDYEVEYVIAPEKEDAYSIFGNFTATNLKTCESKTYKFEQSDKSGMWFYLGDGNSVSLAFEIKTNLNAGTWYNPAIWYQSSGNPCKNEQNPQCNKKVAEVMRYISS